METMTEVATSSVADKALKRQLTAEMIYPSIAAWKAGRAIGLLLNAIPIPIGRHRLSMYLFALPVAPLAAALYGAQKAFGVRYRLSGDALQELPMIGDSVNEQVSLCDIEEIEISVRAGQPFHRAGDLRVVGQGGATLLVLAGVTRPERVRAAILDVRDSEAKISDVFETLRVRTPIEVLQAQAAKEKAEAAAKKKAAAEKKKAAEAAEAD